MPHLNGNGSYAAFRISLGAPRSLHDSHISVSRLALRTTQVINDSGLAALHLAAGLQISARYSSSTSTK